MAGIGHNGGPVVEGASWRRHCWGQARAALVPTLPIEIVRNRVRRAQELGLDYKTYAGLRATTGRDLVAFLFSSNALGVFRDGAALAEGRQAKLQSLVADRHVGVGPGLDADALASRVGAVSAIRIPDFGRPWSAMRDDIKVWLRDQRIPGDAVLMVGETANERELSAAGGLAGFLTGTRYFEGRSDAI